jgi:hypothetical protein
MGPPRAETTHPQREPAEVGADWTERQAMAAATVAQAPTTRQAARLLEKALPFYPQGDPARALALVLRAVALAPSAPPDPALQDAIDASAIGEAFWMGFVCRGLLDRPEAEVDALVAAARQSSPVTADRIEERRAEARAQARMQEATEAATLALDTSGHASPDELRAAIEHLTAAGAWWVLRDAAPRLARAGRADAARLAAARALALASGHPARLSSVHGAHAELHKAEGDHPAAARAYLEACLSAAGEIPGWALDQLRLALKRARAPGDAVVLRDELHALVMEGAHDQARLRLEQLLAQRATHPTPATRPQPRGPRNATPSVEAEGRSSTGPGASAPPAGPGVA